MVDVTVASLSRASRPSPSDGKGRQPSRYPARGRRAGRSVAAMLAGIVLSVAFPPHDLWLLAPVAVAALALLVRGRRWRVAYGLGVLFGLGFLVPLLTWS